MAQGKNPTVPSQSDAPEESDLWTAWQLFPLDDDQTCHPKTAEVHIPLTSYGKRSRGRGDETISPRRSLMVIYKADELNGRQWKIPLFTQACSVVAPCAFSRPLSTYNEESRPHWRTIIIPLLIAPTSHNHPSRKWIYIFYIYYGLSFCFRYFRGGMSQSKHIKNDFLIYINARRVSAQLPRDFSH